MFLPSPVFLAFNELERTWIKNVSCLSCLNGSYAPECMWAVIQTIVCMSPLCMCAYGASCLHNVGLHGISAFFQTYCVTQMTLWSMLLPFNWLLLAPLVSWCAVTLEHLLLLDGGIPYTLVAQSSMLLWMMEESIHVTFIYLLCILALLCKSCLKYIVSYSAACMYIINSQVAVHLTHQDTILLEEHYGGGAEPRGYTMHI